MQKSGRRNDYPLLRQAAVYLQGQKHQSNEVRQTDHTSSKRNMQTRLLQ